MKDEDIRLSMRAFVFALSFVIPVMAGTNAYAHRTAEVCHKDKSHIEQSHLAEKQKTSFAQERNASLFAWLQVAPSQEIADIWGEPEITRDMLYWRIPLEQGQITGKEIFQEGEKHCFYISWESRSVLVTESMEDTNVPPARTVQLVVR